MNNGQTPERFSRKQREQWSTFGYVLSLLPAALDSQMRQTTGIAYFDFRVLSALSQAPDGTLRMNELASYIGSSLSRLSNGVRRLEERKWVRRNADPSDGRFTLATLTSSGFAKVEAATPSQTAEVMRLVFNTLSDAQLRQLVSISRCILEALDAPCPDWGILYNQWPQNHPENGGASLGKA